MARTLDFSIIAPERSKFTDEDGTEYQFEMQGDFGAVTQARYNKTNKLMRESSAKLESDPSDEHAAKGVETAMRMMIHIILPKLPSNRLMDLRVGQMYQIMNFWMEENGVKHAIQAQQKPVIETGLAKEVAAKASKKK